MDKFKNLDLLRKAYEQKRLNQGEVAEFLGVSREKFNGWINGRHEPPRQEVWKQNFIDLLIAKLELSKNHQQFYKIWTQVMVEVWGWSPLSEEEIVALNLEPPLALFLNVPARPLDYRLVGRKDLLADLKSRLTPGQRIVLTGMPGVGKTILAIELTHDYEVMKQFVDGIVWVRIGQQPDITGELNRLAEGLGLDISKLVTEVERYQAIKNAIGRRHFLFVIDDIWHKKLTEIQHFFNFDNPNCCYVLTTRDLKVARSFAQTNSIIHILELEYEQENNPAYELLTHFAPEAGITDPSTAQSLVAAVGGLPLALVLLGGYLRNPERSILSEERIKGLSEMNDPHRRLQLAQQRLGAVEDKTLTLHEVIALSLDTLPEYMVSSFFALGAFAAKPDRFDRTAAQTVTRADNVTLSTLIARHLLEIDQQEQCTIHQVLADVARTKTPTEATERHREYYLTMVKEYQDWQRDDWQQIEKFYGQVKQALNQLITRSAEVKKLFEFVWAVRTYQYSRFLWNDTIDWFNQVIQRAKIKGVDEPIVLSNFALGYIYTMLGQAEQAIQLYEECLKTSEKLGDFLPLSFKLEIYSNLACLYGLYQNQYDKATQLFDKILALSHEANDRNEEVISNLDQRNSFNRVYQSNQVAEKFLAVHQEHTERLPRIMNALMTGINPSIPNISDEIKPEIDQIIHMYEQNLALSREIGDNKNDVFFVFQLAYYYSRQQQFDKALEMFQTVLDTARRRGNRMIEVATLQRMASIYDQQQNFDQAIQLYKECLVIYREVENRLAEASILSRLAYIYSHLRQLDQTLQTLKEFRSISRETQHSWYLTLFTSITWILGQIADKIRTGKISLTPIFDVIILFQPIFFLLEKVAKTTLNVIAFLLTSVWKLVKVALNMLLFLLLLIVSSLWLLLRPLIFRELLFWLIAPKLLAPDERREIFKERVLRLILFVAFVIIVGRMLWIILIN